MVEWHLAERGLCHVLLNLCSGPSGAFVPIGKFSPSFEWRTFTAFMKKWIQSSKRDERVFVSPCAPVSFWLPQKEWHIMSNLHRAFEDDALASSHPLSPPLEDVQWPAEIEGMFNSITYFKVCKLAMNTYVCMVPVCCECATHRCIWCSRCREPRCSGCWRTSCRKELSPKESKQVTSSFSLCVSVVPQCDVTDQMGGKAEHVTNVL